MASRSEAIQPSSADPVGSSFGPLSTACVDRAYSETAGRQHAGRLHYYIRTNCVLNAFIFPNCSTKIALKNVMVFVHTDVVIGQRILGGSLLTQTPDRDRLVFRESGIEFGSISHAVDGHQILFSGEHAVDAVLIVHVARNGDRRREPFGQQLDPTDDGTFDETVTC